MTDKVRIGGTVQPETERLLKRLAQQEFRSISGTLELLILREAAERGLLARAPALVPSGSVAKGTQN